MQTPDEPLRSVTFSDVISSYIGVFIVAWLVTILVTPLMRVIALRYGIIDHPDESRKKHLEPVAYLGGIAILAGWLAGIVVCWWVTPHLPQRFDVQQVSFPLSIIAGAIIITVVGCIDDIYGIIPRVKVGGQLFAAAMVASTDLGTALVSSTLKSLNLPDPMLMGFTLSYVLGAVVIAVFVIGACNAVNLLDGLDGLVAGSLTISFIGFLVIASYVAINLSDPTVIATASDHLTDPVRVVMCLAVLGTLLGFLPHNFNPASIFMGDAGSLLLGYLSATTILLFAHSIKVGPLLVIAALIVFSLPITDTALAIFRRAMAREPIFQGDNRHLHHHLVRAFEGLGCGPDTSIKLAVTAMYLLSAVFAVLGCALVVIRFRFVIAVFAIFCGFVVVMGYKSGRKHLLILRNKARDSAEPAPPQRIASAPTTPARTTVQNPHSTSH